MFLILSFVLTVMCCVKQAVLFLPCAIKRATCCDLISLFITVKYESRVNLSLADRRACKFLWSCLENGETCATLTLRAYTQTCVVLQQNIRA